LNQHSIHFHTPPERDHLCVQGRLYDLPAGGDPEAALWAIVKNPALLNEREAELAAVAYQADRRTWRLVRDFGTTPLYYAPQPGGFVWSLSYRGILDLLGRPEPDEGTLFDYLCTHYRHIFRGPARTFHRNVFQVPAGCWVDIGLDGTVTTHQWLDLSPDPEAARLGPQEATGRFMDILRENVRLRALGAARPAFTVSSGLDSSTVASLASEHLGDIDVFSVGYRGVGVEEYDETAGVAELTRGRNWRWTHLLLERPDLIEDTRALISLTGSPVVTVTWLAYYLMARQLSGFTEIFTGIGGDESLAGEFVHFFYFFADLKQAGEQTRLEREVEAWSRLHDHPVFKKNWGVLEKFWARNIDFSTGEMRVDPEVYRANWRFFNPDRLEVYGPPQPPMPRPFPGYLSNKLYQELIYETTPPTLWGLFMANQALGLTGVSPFLSPRLFRLALGLPGWVKYDNGLTKALMRRGLGGVLPESLRLNHVKTGFNAPIHQWFKESQVAGPTLELLRDGPLAKRGWLKPGAAETIFREHESGQANHMMLLWPLLNASLFLE
jgi:asparagine synthase (glutamine-hydrolysing)